MFPALPTGMHRASSSPIASRISNAAVFWPSSRKAAAFEILDAIGRSEEHTSELQSHVNIVCRLLLEKKKRELTLIEGTALTTTEQNVFPELDTDIQLHLEAWHWRLKQGKTSSILHTRATGLRKLETP